MKSYKPPFIQQSNCNMGDEEPSIAPLAALTAAKVAAGVAAGLATAALRVDYARSHRRLNKTL